MSGGWIVIPRWTGKTGFQHYKDRDPKWIKVYTRLHHDDAFRALSGHQRSVLLGLWLEYASSDGQLALNTTSLSSRLGLRVSSRQLETLNQAGFIQVSASKPLALSYKPASPEEETETEEEKEDPYPSKEGDVECRKCGGSVRPRSVCRNCGANPREAGSNSRVVAKRHSALHRAEQFTLNAGLHYEPIDYDHELARYHLPPDEYDQVHALYDHLRPKALAQEAVAVAASSSGSDFLEPEDAGPPDTENWEGA